jgi:peptidoglycan/xylan/chitin deacetylase (PgdA/CDA1 family)
VSWTGDLRNRSRGAVFLCYHSVAASGPRYLTVTPELFERQLDHYSRRGLRTGGLEELRAVAAGGRNDASLYLTFDDGFADNYETAMPMLRERGHRAFIFVLPPAVDDGGPLSWPEVSGLAPDPTTMRSVTWAMLEEMKEAGFEVGSHTLSHPFLSQLDDEALRQELWDSRSRIVERLGSCSVLAYPFGDWDARVAAAARDCGYEFAFTQPTRCGQQHATPLSIPRVNIDYRDSGPRLDLKLSALGRRLLLSRRVTGMRRRAGRLLSPGES